MADQEYSHHLEVLAERWARALEAAGFDTAIVAAGSPRNYFLDDQAPPWRSNPHFTQWLPGGAFPHSALLLRPGQRPRLYFHGPEDYWHQPPAVPDWIGSAMEVLLFDDTLRLDAAVAAAAASNRTARIAEPGATAALPGVVDNPPLLLDLLHFERARKTPFELACMREATALAVRGHAAAHAAYLDGASEYRIHMQYLLASGQTSEDLPYPSIVAQNTHAGVLHYQHYDRDPPTVRRSFLIDAGATWRGYAADVTRTYTAAGAPDGDVFESLVTALDRAQLALIAGIRPGLDYVALHEAAHRAVAAILAGHALVTCSAEAAFDTGITRAFLPHGLGHLIGLQTHDVGGLQAEAAGRLRPPPAIYPALRLTRTVEPDQVFTIEPGLYFIPMLLAELARADAGRYVDWSLVDRLRPFGGIRIEDNVVVTASGTQNLTRAAFARTQGTVQS
ncbi:MAG: Xaa-Pro dipeptidase [Pseudomonadales bacterium]|nr:Xaa-Pro dipeptidase [Pseudomonadales bacterium]